MRPCSGHNGRAPHPIIAERRADAVRPYNPPSAVCRLPSIGYGIIPIQRIGIRGAWLTPFASALAAERSPAMVAKVSAPIDDGVMSPRPWHHSHFHVKIACDAAAVAILLAFVGLYLAIALLV